MTVAVPISIVVPSLNQGRFLAETLQSLVDQDYGALEVIVQDGGSTDGSIEIARDFALRRPELFKVFVEKDAGQADALNRGFGKATGDILGFLNSDDVLMPGVLRRVAAEVDPGRGRFIVMGRCIFGGEGTRYVGAEHPSRFEGHFEQLAIWKRGYNTIPQPSTFWHRSVWQRCGGFDIAESHVLDYELFCRFSRHYVFHRVDEVWSMYRMHPASKSASATEAEILAWSIAASRRHWGPVYFPLRWRCELSHLLWSMQFHERARHHARRAEEASHQGRRLSWLWEVIRTSAFSPRMAWNRLVLGWYVARKSAFIQKLHRPK
jgi:glycosyltransferase involved in cell wall biosynthesis